MKLFSALVSIIILSAILENILPWWSVAPIAFIIAYLFKLNWYQAFLAGFIALFILWAGMAFFIDRSNEHILSDKVSALFFKSIKPFALIILTGVIGGLVAGIAGLAGSFLVKE